MPLSSLRTIHRVAYSLSPHHVSIGMQVPQRLNDSEQMKLIICQLRTGPMFQAFLKTTLEEKHAFSLISSVESRSWDLNSGVAYQILGIVFGTRS
jgi:transposase